jgi:L-glutamine-phosphate cytidylyltransferase
MEALILAAGKGSRLHPHTDHIPKCLLEVGGKSILDHQLTVLERSGINRVHIVTGNLDQVVQAHLHKHWSHLSIDVIYNPYYEFTNVIGSFWFGIQRIQDDFVYMHADTIFDLAILQRLLAAKSAICLAVQRKPCGEEEMKVYTEGARLRYITKTRSAVEAYGEFLGVAKLDRQVVPYLQQQASSSMRSKQFNLFFEAILQSICDEDLFPIELVDVAQLYWNEIDFIEDLERARTEFGRSDLAHL